jgi:hypothetical protein
MKRAARVRMEAQANIAAVAAWQARRIAMRLPKSRAEVTDVPEWQQLRSVDNAIEPVQAQNEALDRASAAVDRGILRLQRHLLELKG